MCMCMGYLFCVLAVLWRCFSHLVVFLYLMEEETSLLVLVPAGIATVIEVKWTAFFFICYHCMLLSHSLTFCSFFFIVALILTYCIFPCWFSFQLICSTNSPITCVLYPHTCTHTCTHSLTHAHTHIQIELNSFGKFAKPFG